MHMSATWTFYDGANKTTCTSFPYAFRTMFFTLKKAVEGGKKPEELTKRFRIVSPLNREYNFYRATELATQQGLLTASGEINSKEFKR